jgi:hypothetical protein
VTPVALLAALHDLGAEAYRVGDDMIRLRPANVLTPEIINRVREQKVALLPLLPPLPAEPPTAPYEAARVIDPGDAAGPDTHHPHHPHRPEQWRLVVKSMDLRPPPIELDRARSVVRNVAGHVETLLAKLEITVAHRNAGRATYYTESIDEWLGELNLCGADVGLESVQ